jgi:hypothetical protein
MKLSASPVKQRAHGARPDRRAAGNAAHPGAAGTAAGCRTRSAGGGRLRAAAAAGSARHSEAGLHQHPCLAAAALARRGTDPACDPGRRRTNRHHADADGCRSGHRPHAGRMHGRHPRHGQCRHTARQAGERRAPGCWSTRCPTCSPVEITPTPQPEAGACYASKISKAEAPRFRPARDGTEPQHPRVRPLSRAP